MSIEEIKGGAHVGFFVRDLDVTKRFYCGILGFEAVFERSEELPQGGTVRIAFLRLGDFMFEAICAPGMELPADGCFQHVAFRVENIEAAAQKLQEAGVETDELVHSPVTFANGAKWVTFRGPDGEHLEINEIL